jgi:methionyl-tRNA formyltransferase
MVEKRRVIFIGTPEFAIPPLQKLLDSSSEVCAVFTQPDRPSGRGKRLQASPVKLLAQSKAIPVFQPGKIRAEENQPIFDSLRPDFIVVAAYGQILPGWLLRAASIATVNIHASLLPRYRGAAPIAWSILNGDETTGITTMLMDEKLDSGPILMQRAISISSSATTGELTLLLADLGAELLFETLDGMGSNLIRPIPQDETMVTWAPRIGKEAAAIDWNKPARDIHNKIRAMNPWPGAHTDFRGQRIQIWRSRVEDQLDLQNTPGVLLGLSDSGIRVQCGEGSAIDLLQVQAPAKTRITGREFANGVHLRAGEQLFPA